ncbi:MAG: C39 family peptidase [Methylohalobius sp. ZOD2]|nr:C39 family peptidase [Methylothermaceae bacterium]
MKKGRLNASLWGWLVMLGLLTGPAEVNARVVKSLLEMRHEKVVMQEWDLSCGAAALTTILRNQYGDSVSEKEVAKGLMQRDIYIKNPILVNLRQGFSLFDLKRYVDARGYHGVGYGKLALADLIERAPIMVPLNLHGYNHFVIFRGKRANRVLLSDPAWGNRTMTIERFKDVWIDYTELGHVGFVVLNQEGRQPPNRMAPRSEDFVMLR